MALSTLEKQTYIKDRSAHDLYLRARIGPVFYILGILVTALNNQMYQNFLPHVIAMLVTFTVIALIRFSQEMPPKNQQSLIVWRRQTLAITYLSCWAWGLCLSWMFLHPELDNALQTMLVCTFAYSTATAHQFCIERIHGKLASIIFFLPALFTILAFRPDKVTLVYVISIYSIYLVLTGVRGNREYVSALNTEIGLLEAQQNLKDLSLTDELTSLANRRHYRTFLEQAFSAAKNKEHSLFVILLDLDFFKKINDNYGHLVGDICLQKTAEILTKHFKRDEDLVARIGGEEFAVIITDTSFDHALALTEAAHAQIASTQISSGDITIRFTASFGISQYTEALDHQPNDMVKRADELLFSAKNSGRNRIKYLAQKNEKRTG